MIDTVQLSVTGLVVSAIKLQLGSHANIQTRSPQKGLKVPRKLDPQLRELWSHSERIARAESAERDRIGIRVSCRKICAH